MKHGRAKAARKTLKFFSLNANIKPPYKVILDGNFLAAAMKFKVPIIERIGNILQTTEFSLFVPRSAIVELGNLQDDDGATIFADARQFGLDECEIIERSDIPSDQSRNDGHGNGGESESELTPSHDIQVIVNDGNKDCYFVATQDKVLSDTLRDMIYVPQMWLTKGGVLIFDTPSGASRKFAQGEERVKQKTGGGTMTQEESNLIRRLREESREKNFNRNKRGGGGNIDGQRKKRKAKGPNPLSCKKKKAETKEVTVEKRKRRRRKKTSEE